MEFRETLARIFRKKATPPQPVTREQELGPAVQDRLARIRQRSEQQKLAELAHIAHRFQSEQKVVSPPATTPEATSLPAEPPTQVAPPPQEQKSTLSERKTANLDPEALKRSLKTPTSTWGQPKPKEES